MANTNILDPSTWVTCTLDTPYGPIIYWVLPDLEAYQEQWMIDANQTQVLMAVRWDESGLFKRYALGFTPLSPTTARLNRFIPLQNEFAHTQYLVSLTKVLIHSGVDANGEPQYVGVDALLGNWFGFPPQDPNGGMQARIVYKGLFACPPYDIIEQSLFADTGYYELRRYVVRDDTINPRERRIPSYGFETDDSARQVVPEVGFIPYYDYEFTRTWMRVPYDNIPWDAIASCVLKINNAVFDYKSMYRTGENPGTVWGKYRKGCVLFKGLGGRVRPYRGTNGEWLADLPYIFTFQPADGTDDGMLKIPRNDGSWVKVRARQSGLTPSVGAWNFSTAYSVGQTVSNDGNVYSCITAGTSGAFPVTGPTGQGQDITDNTVHWKWIGTVAVKYLYEEATLTNLFFPQLAPG